MVSIIIPLYNAEKYMTDCIGSVLAQTEREFQLILVDDGSVDATPALCDAFALQDSRVKVIHQKNAGASAARNAGLNAATGEWICFVDADDTLLPQMLERTVSAAKRFGVELVLFDPYVRIGEQTTVDSMPFFPESTLVDKKDISPKMLRFMAGTVWRMLYSRALIERNRLRFDRALPLSEDRLFNIEALGCCQKLYYLREPLYNYLINPTSAVRKYREDMLELVLKTHNSMEQALRLYWGEPYLSIYERVNLVDGALLCVYNTYSHKSPLSSAERHDRIKQIVNEPRILEAYGKLENRTVRQSMVYRKQVRLLCLTAWLWNARHKSKE